MIIVDVLHKVDMLYKILKKLQEDLRENFVICVKTLRFEIESY